MARGQDQALLDYAFVTRGFIGQAHGAGNNIRKALAVACPGSSAQLRPEMARSNCLIRDCIRHQSTSSVGGYCHGEHCCGLKRSAVAAALARRSHCDPALGLLRKQDTHGRRLGVAYALDAIGYAQLPSRRSWLCAVNGRLAYLKQTEAVLTGLLIGIASRFASRCAANW